MSRKTPEKPPEVREAFAQEMENRYETSLVAARVGAAIAGGADLHMTAESFNGHMPIGNTELDLYKALVTEKSVTVAGTEMVFDDQGLGANLTMTVPGATSAESNVRFTLNIGGRIQINLPYNNTRIDSNYISDQLPPEDKDYLAPVLPGITHLANTIGIMPPTVFAATDMFLRNQVYTVPTEN